MTHLADQIKSTIHQHGPIPFVDFMHQALYAQNLGYYSGELAKLGPAGDFITAPELTPLFGITLANQCHPILKNLQDPTILEFGAGSGQLCVDLLMRLESLGSLPRAYYILEVSAGLKARQGALILQKIPHLFDKIQWLSTWPTTEFEGIILANEVLDAMPVHVFLQTDTEILEGYVGLNEESALTWVFRPCANERLKVHVQHVLPSSCFPYQSEANLFIDDWVKQCATLLRRGVILLLDYGFGRTEYYHPDRAQGTLMCHHKHRAHANPLVHVGEQDITAHVDFTHVAEAAVAAGLHVAGYTNQASFLLANGLLDTLSGIADERSRIKEQQAVKQLTHPHDMGELFKVIALTKAYTDSLSGFEWYDKRVNL